MWRKPSKRFWLIKSAFFALLFPALLVCGLLIVYAAGMAGPGPSPKYPLWLAIPGWMVITPFRPGPRFPTSSGFVNLFITIGVNAFLWSYVLSFLASLVISGMIRLFRRGRAA